MKRGGKWRLWTSPFANLFFTHLKRSPVAIFHVDGTGFLGWSGELHVLDLTGLARGVVQWHHPTGHGTPPLPMAAHSAIVDASGDTMVLFGGRAKHNRINDMSLLHLPTMRWQSRYARKSGVPGPPKARSRRRALLPPTSAHHFIPIATCSASSRPGVENPQTPEARSWHVAQWLPPHHMFVYGGLGPDPEGQSSAHARCFHDAWTYDLQKETWQQQDFDAPPR